MSGPLWVKYFPSDYLDGVELLSVVEELAYWRICTLIYKTGGPIRLSNQQLARFTKAEWRWRKIKAALISHGKIFETEDGSLTNQRCATELEKSTRNLVQKIAAGSASAKTGKSLKNLKRPPNGPPNDAPNGPPNDARARRGTEGAPGESKKVEYINNNLLGRCAPPRARMRAREAEPPEPPRAPTAQEIAEVDALVKQATAALNGSAPKRNGHLADPIAYAAAVKDTKRETWLNELATWVGPHLDGDARLQAWEAIEQARTAGSRKATPPHVRKLLDTLDQLHRKQQDAGDARARD